MASLAVEVATLEKEEKRKRKRNKAEKRAVSVLYAEFKLRSGGSARIRLLSGRISKSDSVCGAIGHGIQFTEWGGRKGQERAEARGTATSVNIIRVLTGYWSARMVGFGDLSASIPKASQSQSLNNIVKYPLNVKSPGASHFQVPKKDAPVAINRSPVLLRTVLTSSLPSLRVCDIKTQDSKYQAVQAKQRSPTPKDFLDSEATCIDAFARGENRALRFSWQKELVLDSVDVQSVMPMTTLSKGAPGRGLGKEQELLTSGSISRREFSTTFDVEFLPETLSTAWIALKSLIFLRATAAGGLRRSSIEDRKCGTGKGERGDSNWARTTTIPISNTAPETSPTPFPPPTKWMWISRFPVSFNISYDGSAPRYLRFCVWKANHVQSFQVDIDSHQ
ncbi:hypothetical protein BJ912DRAFT_935270 [Pholiota molesta]|nr:hypothetical protein BJ912DRAFT_935270 [Pholiota molesta]